MNEWNDNQWREFFGDHSLELRTDKWFTRRVLNRLPRKRWSIEAKISFVGTCYCNLYGSMPDICQRNDFQSLLDLCTHLVGLHGVVCGLRVVRRTVGIFPAQDL